MKHAFKKVGILLRDQQQAFPLGELQGAFAEQGIGVVLLDGAGQPPPVDLVMAMGGDGTVLRALARFPRCPVLAVNFGKVGFLTADDQKNLERIIQRLMKGKFLMSERLALNCEYPGGAARAINEVEVRTIHRLIFLDVFVDNTKIRTIVGDGVVVGTPTGSTGFLLSAGGPIVMPDVRCMILDGINEYTFSSRALILDPGSRVRIHINEETRAPHVYLIVDGQRLCRLEPGQEVHIDQSQDTAKLIYFKKNYFFRNLSSKLSW